MAGWIQSVLLIGILFFSQFSPVEACLPNEDWDKIICEKVPQARVQLETYKKIYSSHSEKYKDDEIYSSHVDGLQIPLGWLYANAYQRLHELETGGSDIIKNWDKHLQLL